MITLLVLAFLLGTLAGAFALLALAPNLWNRTWPWERREIQRMARAAQS